MADLSVDPIGIRSGIRSVCVLFLLNIINQESNGSSIGLNYLDKTCT